MLRRQSKKSIFRSILFWFGCTLILYVSTLLIGYFGLDGRFPTKLQILFTDAKGLLSNIVASFVLYYLVVHLPAQHKRAVLRASCKKMYLSTKRQILYEILSGSWSGGRKDIDFSMESIDGLMKPDNFKNLFQGGKNADEGFYAFSNYIQSNETAFRSVIFKFKLVARQLEFVLNNVDFSDEKKFQNLKWLEESLYELDNLHAGYDNEKVLSRAIWSVFGGWSDIYGYGDYDPIEKAIDEI